MSQDLIIQHSDDLLSDSEHIIEAAQHTAYNAVDRILVLRNWLLGKRISEENLNGKRSERYGDKIIPELSKQLTERFGRGFDKRTLYQYVKFYKLYPEIVGSLTTQSSDTAKNEIVGSVNPQSFAPMVSEVYKKDLLSWTHYTKLIQVADSDARAWYEKEAFEQTWSVRTLQRNISTQYYDRIIMSRDKQPVIAEMQEKTAEYQLEKASFVKNPYILEFLGLPEDPSITEPKLESAIITYLQKFLMEMGKGYAFVARQQRIHTEKEDYYIDLVFFNYILNCFVLIDLKMGKITHQDVGQMDMYVRMYDERQKKPEHNPTLGIVLCSETDEDIARYSVLKGNEQLFASKYRLCLPSEEQLRTEIETQKEMFYMQHPELRNQDE